MADIFGYGEKDQHFITYSLVIIMSIFCLIFINLFDVITILDDRVISLESQFISDEILKVFRNIIILIQDVSEIIWHHFKIISMHSDHENLEKLRDEKNIFFQWKNDVTSPYYLSVSPAVIRLTVYRRCQVGNVKNNVGEKFENLFHFL